MDLQPRDLVVADGVELQLPSEGVEKYQMRFAIDVQQEYLILVLLLHTADNHVAISPFFFERKKKCG